MLVILADDLTGALDSAAPFAGRRLRTEIALEPEVIDSIVVDRPDVLSVNLNTREIGESEAREKTAAVVARLPDGVRLFKKIDSRLKGNIAAELDAIRFTKALAAPAIPDFKRIVEGGFVRGFGVDMPIDIVRRFGSHAMRVISPDTLTSIDIDSALSAAEEDDTDLLIGARGLAEALARRMTACPETVAEIPAGRATFVIGSRDPITLAQIEVLREGCSLNYLAAPNGRLTGGGDATARLTLIQATPGEETINPQCVSEALADSVKDGLSGCNDTLVLSGGATADAVLRGLGLSRLRLHGECLPGLGLASAQGRCIIAKSGGFGHPDTLRHVADMILRKAG